MRALLSLTGLEPVGNVGVDPLDEANSVSQDTDRLIWRQGSLAQRSTLSLDAVALVIQEAQVTPFFPPFSTSNWLDTFMNEQCVRTIKQVYTNTT
jgi:hypothetical protein